MYVDAFYTERKEGIVTLWIRVYFERERERWLRLTGHFLTAYHRALSHSLQERTACNRSRRARSTDTMSKANVAHETLVRAREADKRREAELRIEARQQRQINERIQEANNQVEARMLSLLTFCVLLPVCRVLTAALTLRLNACTTAGNDTN